MPQKWTVLKKVCSNLFYYLLLLNCITQIFEILKSYNLLFLTFPRRCMHPVRRHTWFASVQLKIPPLSINNGRQNKNVRDQRYRLVADAMQIRTIGRCCVKDKAEEIVLRGLVIFSLPFLVIRNEITFSAFA